MSDSPSIKTLIVEDNDLVREALRRLVESTEGLCVTGETGDVPAALIAFQTHQPDIAILDLALPSGSGLDILRYIRRTNRVCRIIMFSGTMTEWEAEACRSEGADHCFNKLFDLDRLRQTLRELGRQACPP